MTAIRKEVYSFIDELPDNKLEALRPLLSMLVDNSLIIETNLTDDEKNIIQLGREKYFKNPSAFVSLESVI